jgi:hypothetical protein
MNIHGIVIAGNYRNQNEQYSNDKKYKRLWEFHIEKGLAFV